MEYSSICNDLDFWTAAVTKPQKELRELFRVVEPVNGSSLVSALEVFMRVLMIALAVLYLSGSTFGQPGKPGDTDQATQLENPITKRQLLELPRRDKAPQMPLQRALKIAETFIKKQKLDISSCYLFQAELTSEQVPEKSRWAFWWVSVRENDATAKDIWITVTMDDKAQLQ